MCHTWPMKSGLDLNAFKINSPILMHSSSIGSSLPINTFFYLEGDYVLKYMHNNIVNARIKYPSVWIFYGIFYGSYKLYIYKFPLPQIP